MIKMACATVEAVCSHDEILVILNTSLELKTYIKGHHVYNEVWTPEVGDKLKVLMEPENCVDKFAVCVEKDIRQWLLIWKGYSGKFAKTIYYFLRSDTYCNCFAEVS